MSKKLLSSPDPDALCRPQPGTNDQGFWQIDIASGDTWFSDWFYEQLGWLADGRRAALTDLKACLTAAAWSQLLTDIRTHLEGGAPLDTALHVRLLSGEHSWWLFRGSAGRSASRHPQHLTGSVRDMGRVRPGAAVVALPR